MISIVVPAHNESRVIIRCLQTILTGAGPDEVEIVVVCNGCTDDTAQTVRQFGDPRVRVIETPVGSKIHALNLGDAAVTAFPRFYVDADIELEIGAVRDVVDLLASDPTAVVAAPRAVVDCSDRPWFVRSFYRIWTRMPYFSENMIGSGVYAFSKEGRARFGAFPDLAGDDEYARLIAEPSERKTTKSSTFVIHPPRTVDGLLKIMTRARAARYELKAHFPALQANGNTGPVRTIRTLITSPSMWPDVPTYVGVTLLTVFRARKKIRSKAQRVWERDDTSRT
jgi:glycosyltransferase involved in cell wall biosynthesis